MSLRTVVVCGLLFNIIGGLLPADWTEAPAARAQGAFDIISRDRNFSASNYCIYPDTTSPVMTPAPPGKRPFYISHYGRHGSRYLSNRKGYDIPYNMLCRADSMGLLTDVGKRVKEEIKYIIDESEGRWGDLSGIGKRQHRNIAHRMAERYPEVFQAAARIEAHSTTVNRCILSMGSFLQELTALNPRLEVTLDANQQNMFYMNHQDRQLRDSMMTYAARKAYQAFCDPIEHNPRLMDLLFVSPDSAMKVVNEVDLNYYIIKTGIIQQNTNLSTKTNLIDLFSYEELHHFWQKENAWWYFTYGPSPLNGGCQPYTQRYLLRRIIADADSSLASPRPGATLRFGHETVLLPLTCLLGLNGFDLQINELDRLEEAGWWACLVFPMASNIQFVFYRQDDRDRDIVFKVLLNEHEARLPLQTDMAPYYHWKDFREYYLKKLDDYDRQRAQK